MPLRAVVKNTFLAIQADEELKASRLLADAGSSVRARSADTVMRHRTSFEWLSDEMQIGHLNQVISLPPGDWQPDSVPITAEKAPSVDELRELQRKLSEEMSKVKRVTSSSSVSTMADETVGLPHVWSSNSINSMVSGLSDFWDELCSEDSPIDFGPIFEKASSEFTTDQQLERLQDFSHGRVPKNLNLAEEFTRGSHEGPPTTMMIRNIPNRYTQRELIRELESLGFAGTFDFLYVPIDKGTMCNVGYAFVNFIDHNQAARCMKVFDNYAFAKHRKARGKIATVSVAHIQGLEANIRHYENAAVNGVARSRQRGPVIMASITKSLAPRH